MITVSRRLADALALAIEAHDGQVRKGTAMPYIAHPLAVASLVLDYGGSEDQAIAAMLHDVIEDGKSKPGCAPYATRVLEAFGPAVLAMVESCTDGTAEDKAAAIDPRADWQVRKERYLAALSRHPADDPALLVSACDKLHNARAILSDLRAEGPTVFDRFKAGKSGTLWYYDAIAELLAAKGAAPAAELAKVIDNIAQEAQT